VKFFWFILAHYVAQNSCLVNVSLVQLPSKLARTKLHFQPTLVCFMLFIPLKLHSDYSKICSVLLKVCSVLLKFCSVLLTLKTNCSDFAIKLHHFLMSQNPQTLPLQLTSFHSISPFIRIYSQSGDHRYYWQIIRIHLSSDTRNCNFSFTNMSICQMQVGIRSRDNKKVGIRCGVWPKTYRDLFSVLQLIVREAKSKETSDRWLWN
jgi:hypothetical protein